MRPTREQPTGPTHLSSFEARPGSGIISSGMSERDVVGIKLAERPTVQPALDFDAGQAVRSWSQALIVLLIGVIALVPRVLDLADFETVDEMYHWFGRVQRFSDALARRDWAETWQAGHPGVTIMAFGSLG